MAHDHSNCLRQHHKNWDESRVMGTLDLVETYVWMAKRGETDEITAVNAIYDALDSLQEPHQPVDLDIFLEFLDEVTRNKILALPQEVIETYRCKIATDLPASEIAEKLGIDEWKVWLHLDAIQDAIHDHGDE